MDGFTAHNVGNLALRGGSPLVTACTPSGVMEILKRNQIEIAGKNATVLGRSNIVGLPMALMLTKCRYFPF